ncbi:MAG TPA: lysylphosphatidylglycerol synthase domain-containing protein [Ktedonobacterales bacterium]
MSVPPSSDARSSDAALTSFVGRLAGLARRHKRLIQVAAMLLIAVFVVAALYKSWNTLRDYHWQVQWGLLILGFLFLVGQELMFALIWRTILRRLGSDLDILASERIYLGAEFVRYIPGNVWHVITRVVWAEQRGVPKTIGLASMVIELATKIFSAALVFAVSLLFWPDLSTLATQTQLPANVALIAGAVAIPLLLLGLHPRLLEAALNAGLRLMRREPTRLTLSYLDLLLITLFWSLSWIVAGIGFYLLTRSIVTPPLPPTLLALAIGIYALGWDVGFLSFITPSGIGFREAAIAGLMVAAGVTTGAGGFAIAFVVAMVSRLLSTGAELVSIALAYLVSGGKMPAAPTSGVASETTPEAGAQTK